jgi:lipoprotein-anchoring transpeptidase ErfK/SrfK
VISFVKQFRGAILCVAAIMACTGCGTVTDMVTTNVPTTKHSGRPSVVVRLHEQRAYLYRGKNLVATSRVSSGREGYRTPTGRFSVISKDADHSSSVYGSYVSASGKIVRANVDVRKGGRPRHTQFVGASMPYYMEFRPAYGLHAGYLPGVPASHGCIRMPYWKARQFYQTVRIGTPVTVKP